MSINLSVCFVCVHPLFHYIIMSVLPPTHHHPRCTEVGSRVAAYDLLVELSSGCYSNFELITTQLVSMHHRPDPQIAKEWEVCDGCVLSYGVYIQTC